MNILEEILQENEAKPIAKINGVDVYTYAEGQKVNRLHLAEEKINGKQDELGERATTADGMHYLETRSTVKVMNPDRYFMNRVRKTKYKGKKAIEIVNDYRAITDQESGRIYTPIISTFIVGVDNGKLTLLGKSKVSDDVFCSEFTNSLDTEDAEKVFSMISEQSKSIKESTSLDDMLA